MSPEFYRGLIAAIILAILFYGIIIAWVWLS
jgi:hypothetical protein